MIRHTFCHLPGIGEQTEQQLWLAGVTSWDAALRCPYVLARVGRLAERIAESGAALASGDWSHFRRVLAGREAWRWLAELRGRCLYLDIETTGLTPGFDAITVIACYDGAEARCFVRDVDLAEFPLYATGYDLLVTYNGATFDVPFLRAYFPHLRLPPVHLDLRYPLARLGYRGGLKRIERALGVARDDDLADLDGYAAVLLWEAHTRGDPRALPTLLRYAAEDVVSLEPLAVLTYNRLSGPLPAPSPVLGPTPRRRLDWPYDLAVLPEVLWRNS